MEKRKVYYKIFVGFFAGIVSGFFCSGGGLILVPFLVDCLKMEEVNARATTIFCVFFMVITSRNFLFKTGLY